MTIYPSILTGSLQEAQEQLDLAKSLDGVETVQLDILDGLFADNVTLTPSDFAQLDFGELHCDLHLMTEEPMDFVFEAIEHKKRLPIRSIIGQVERMSYQLDFMETVMKHTWKAGLSLNIFTPIEAVDESSWYDLNVVQLLAIEAGFQGQEFRPVVLEKVENVLRLRQEIRSDFEIIIDGGIGVSELEKLLKFEVEGVAVGSELWQAGDLQLAYTQLTEVG